MPQSEPGEGSAWWKGARGEWYVVVQSALFVLLAFGPRRGAGLPEFPRPTALPAFVLGIVFMLAGTGLVLAAFARLGKNVTPLPYPKADGHLVETGAYRLVRHPIYCGVLALAFGWALCLHGPLTLGYACLLFVLFDLKSRREERWLVAKYPAYADYQKRVRRLIPFTY